MQLDRRQLGWDVLADIPGAGEIAGMRALERVMEDVPDAARFFFSGNALALGLPASILSTWEAFHQC
ncbi:MAG: hypothetical protein ACRENX_01460 [Candidatus Dormibacteria bacterium]